MSGATLHVTAALARGRTPHRLLAGLGPRGPWCGAGPDAVPLIAGTATEVVTGATAAELIGPAAAEPAVSSAAGRVTAAPARASGAGRAQRAANAGESTATIAFEVAAAHVGAALDEARARLMAAPDADAARSWLVALSQPGTALELWLGLGPPACSIAVRCWPGIVHGRDASGDDHTPAPLALAADEFCAAIEAGSIPEGRVDAVLAAAQGTALAEGALAERHARVMDGAGDDRGAAVRRLVAQAYAVDIALAAFREAVARGGPASGPSVESAQGPSADASQPPARPL